MQPSTNTTLVAPSTDLVRCTQNQRNMLNAQANFFKNQLLKKIIGTTDYNLSFFNMMETTKNLITHAIKYCQFSQEEMTCLEKKECFTLIERIEKYAENISTMLSDSDFMNNHNIELSELFNLSHNMAGFRIQSRIYCPDYTNNNSNGILERLIENQYELIDKECDLDTFKDIALKYYDFSNDLENSPEYHVTQHIIIMKTLDYSWSSILWSQYPLDQIRSRTITYLIDVQISLLNLRACLEKAYTQYLELQKTLAEYDFKQDILPLSYDLEQDISPPLIEPSITATLTNLLHRNTSRDEPTYS